MTIGVRVRNRHARRYAAPPEAVGALLDRLSAADDRLWPGDRWPRMRLDGPLAVGARGGHGPVRYEVQEHEPRVRVRFRFLGPAGFDGHHGFAVMPHGDDGAVLEHVLSMRATGPALVTWPLVFRPLHDALIEDALDRGQRELGLGPVRPRRWSVWVRALRALAQAGRRRP